MTAEAEAEAEVEAVAVAKEEEEMKGTAVVAAAVEARMLVERCPDRCLVRVAESDYFGCCFPSSYVCSAAQSSARACLRLYS